MLLGHLEKTNGPNAFFNAFRALLDIITGTLNNVIL